MFTRQSRDTGQTVNKGLKMTEQVQSFSAEQNQPVSSESVSTPAAAPQSAPQERLFTQSELNRLAGKIRDESYQKGLQDAVSKSQQQTAPAYEYQAPVMQTHAQPQMVGGIPQMTDEQISQKVLEAQQKIENTRQYNALVNSLVSKVEAGKNKYEDFESVVKPINFLNTPIWHVAEKFDNPADIVYHLGKNPGKLAQLLTVGYSPELVERGMREISESLKQNEAATQEKQPSPPLSRQKPSNIGMGNGDKNGLSVQDWKKIYRV